MLPFRSGRAGIVSAVAAFSLLILLSCAVVAADKKSSRSEPKKSPATTTPASQKKPTRPKPEEGIKDVPIPEGHDARGLTLPDYDIQGRLRGKLQAGVTRRLDPENVEFHGVRFTTFIPETEAPNLDITVDTAVFNLKTQVLTSNVRSTVKRSDFEVSGDRMRFEMLTRQSTIEGNVKMIVHGKARTPSEQEQQQPQQ
jgi:Lipopolysaccharide-assembly, LptC-related